MSASALRDLEEDGRRVRAVPLVERAVLQQVERPAPEHPWVRGRRIRGVAEVRPVEVAAQRPDAGRVFGAARDERLPQVAAGPAVEDVARIAVVVVVRRGGHLEKQGEQVSHVME